MSKGNNYPKYVLKKKVDGALVLDDTTDEAVAHMTAKGESSEAICELLKVDTDRIAILEADPFFVRRVKFLQAEYAAVRKLTTPKTADDYLQYALQRLHSLTRSSKGDIKSKIAATKALGELANGILKGNDKMGGQWNHGKEAAPSTALEEITRAYKTTERGDE